MTSRELVKGLQDQIYNLFGEVSFTLKTKDLLYYLNLAQTIILKEDIKVFEQKQYITDRIKSLVIEREILPTASTNRFIVDLPNDYNVLVKHKCVTNSDKFGELVVAGLETQNDDIHVLWKNPFWEPIPKEPLYYIMNDSLIYEVPNNNFTISKTIITFIKKELPIVLKDINGNADTTSELSSSVHNEIIEIARGLIINDKQLNINNKQENNDK